jgi:RNA polymerase sigma-70 factor (ECF subfamily)
VPVPEVPEGVSTDLGPEQHAVDGSVAVTMASLLATLPPSQQEILRLRVAVGLSAEDTAAALGMTAGAVRVAQHRALAKLRGILQTDSGLWEQVI